LNGYTGNRYRKRNNQSARNEMDFVRAEVSRLLEGGQVLECEKPPLCVNPLSMAFKFNWDGSIKKRLVIDFSRWVNRFVVLDQKKAGPFIVYQSGGTADSKKSLLWSCFDWLHRQDQKKASPFLIFKVVAQRTVSSSSCCPALTGYTGKTKRSPVHLYFNKAVVQRTLRRVCCGPGLTGYTGKTKRRPVRL
jgi:hypothetical protein